MGPISRLVREPLFHFLIIGGLLFALYAAVTGPGPAPREVIVIGPEQIEQLAAGFRRVWRRPPSGDEMQALVDDFVREEIYYREALALGLDRDDTVIRRRLRQKMEFLTDTGADLLEPGPGDLEAFYAANEQSFLKPPRLAFEQIFLGENPAAETVKASLRAFRADPGTDPSAWGERTLLPPRMKPSTSRIIDGVFGDGFFDRLGQAPIGEWSGPVASAYGVHLVRLNERLPAELPSLEVARDAVLREWKTSKARELREQLYARLRERYEVELPATVIQAEDDR